MGNCLAESGTRDSCFSIPVDNNVEESHNLLIRCFHPVNALSQVPGTQKVAVRCGCWQAREVEGGFIRLESTNKSWNGSLRR